MTKLQGSSNNILFQPFFILFVVLSILITSCGSEDKRAKLESLKGQREKINKQISELEAELQKSDTTKVEAKLKTVGITSVTAQPFKHFIEIQAKVDADENIALSPKIPGTIVKISSKAGDEVRVGKVLAEMDNQQMISGIEELRTQLAFATNVYEKQKNLWDKKIGTELQYLSAKNNKEALEKKLNTMNEQLDMTRIKSPINGTVDEVNVKIGQSVAPGMPIIRVVNFSHLKITAQVAESYISKVKEGNKALIYFPNLQKEIEAKISFVGRVINPQNRTFTVEAELEKNNADYHPNMIAILKVVDYEVPAAFILPVSLIQNSEKGQYVFVASKEKVKTVAKKQYVEVGQMYSGNAEIKSGLKPGDAVITTGYQGLNEGDLVEIK